MKIPHAIAAAVALVLCGCAVFRRSPTWESVVASRSHYSDAQEASGKGGYIQHLHQILSHAGVEHKVVEYHFHYRNAYREEAVESATAVIYRDDTTPRNPWWVMDEYHNVPLWLPNWKVDAQLEFFIQHEVEVISVKEYAAAAPVHGTVKTAAATHRQLARVAKPRKHRAIGVTQPKRPAKPAVPAPDSDPLTVTSLSGPSASAGSQSDARSTAMFRGTHGSSYDSGSSLDRRKMTELRRQLLTRNHGVGLRVE